MTPRIPPNRTPGPGAVSRPGERVLRLVDTRDGGGEPARAPASDSASWPGVAAANVAAARFAGGLGVMKATPVPAPVAPVLSDTDPRWLLAIKAGSLLEGGRAGLLTPSRRKIVMALAHQLRLRPFDANLVIAVVQDSARAGERLVSPAVKSRLTLVGSATGSGADPRDSSAAPALLAGVALGVALMLGLIGWLLGGW